MSCRLSCGYSRILTTISCWRKVGGVVSRVLFSAMEPHQEFDLDDLVDFEFGGRSESDSGCPPDILSLEDMFSWSEVGDSYTEGSDLPRSPILDGAEEENFIPYMWPEEDEADIPVNSDDGEDLPELPAGLARDDSDFDFDFPPPYPPADNCAVVPWGGCLPAGAETDSEEDESVDLALEIPDELPWYQRSIYWESRYEDLMHDLGEDY